MAASFEKPRDVVGGLVMVGIGGLFLLFGRELPVGTLVPDGAGLFPGDPELADGGLGGGDGGAGVAGAAPGRCVRRGAVAGPGADRRVPRVFFGLALRGLGLVPVLLVVVFATAWASRYASLQGLGALALGIALFCSGLFIKGLGLPLPLTGPWLSAGYWSPPPPPPAAPPRPARRTGPVRKPAPWNCSTIWAWASPPRSALEPALRLRRLPARHRRRRAAGPGAAGHHRHAPAADLLAAAGLGPDHALGHLLRRPVWRLDHRDPDQPAGRELLGGDRDRRLPDGQAGPRRPGAGDRGPGLVLRRHASPP